MWSHGFSKDDGYPRYACAGGMTALAKWMSTELLEAGALTLATRIERLDHDGSHWHLHSDTENVAHAPSMIITAPVPQTLELFEASSLHLEDDTRNSLQAMKYKPVLGLLLTLDAAPAIPAPGAIQASEDEHFTFVADNVAKGVSSTPAVTLHANGVVSAARWDDPEAEVINDFLELARPWISDANVKEAELKRWRYAGPVEPYPHRSLTAIDTPGTIVLGGDAFGGPKVEGAFNSGVACAQAVLAQLS